MPQLQNRLENSAEHVHPAARLAALDTHAAHSSAVETLSHDHASSVQVLVSRMLPLTGRLHTTKHSFCSIDGHELCFKNERRLGWNDAACAAVAVRKFGRDSQLALFTNTHAFDTLVPALDDLPSTKLERQGRVAIIPANTASYAARSRVYSGDAAAKVSSGCVVTDPLPHGSKAPLQRGRRNRTTSQTSCHPPKYRGSAP